jgi:ComF family protein
MGKLQEAIWALKYENTPGLGDPLGARVAACFEQTDWQVELIVPVPLHAKRLRERGYNQAQQIAEPAARRLGLPCIPDALTRTRHTQSQVTLDRQQRQNNMQEAFAANATQVGNRAVLLVDDVYTTGATLAACAQALLDAGVSRVYGLAVTTPPRSGQSTAYPV